MSIAADFTAFKEAMTSDSIKVTTDSCGNWQQMHKLKRPFTDLQFFEKERWYSIAISMVKELDRLEKIPVKFNGSGDQKAMFEEHIEAAKYIKKQLKAFKTSKKVKNQLIALRQRMTGMRYRIEEANGG